MINKLGADRNRPPTSSSGNLSVAFGKYEGELSLVPGDLIYMNRIPAGSRLLRTAIFNKSVATVYVRIVESEFVEAAAPALSNAMSKAYGPYSSGPIPTFEWPLGAEVIRDVFLAFEILAIPSVKPAIIQTRTEYVYSGAPVFHSGPIATEKYPASGGQ